MALADHFAINIATVLQGHSPNEPTIAIKIDDLYIDDLPKHLLAPKPSSTIPSRLSLLGSVDLRESYSVLFVI